MRSYGEEIRDSQVVSKVQRSMTKKFDDVVTTIEESKDLETYTSNKLVGFLHVHGKRMLNKGKNKKEEKAFQAKGERPHQNTRGVKKITLHPQVKAILNIHDAWLDLQDGFMNTCHNGGRPISAFFPLTVSRSSRAGMLFRLCFRVTNSGEGMQRKPVSLLNISYRISGNRNVGAHERVSIEATDAEERKQDMMFKIALTLREPVLDPCLAVGFLPFPRNGLRVGQLITVNWRIERLKDSDHSADAPPNEVVLYEVDADSENWMLAGRKRGHVSFSTTKGTRIVVSVLCVPLVAGYVQPPYLRLPDFDQTNIRCSPPAPHLVCVLPPVLSSSYCILA